MQLNDLDVSTSHLERLVHDLTESPLIGQHFVEEEQISVREILSAFSNSIVRLKSSLRVRSLRFGIFDSLMDLLIIVWH